MKRAFWLLASLNVFALLLATCPVGPCGGPLAVGGIETKPIGGLMTTFDTCVGPMIRYSVVSFLPWLDAQIGLAFRRDRPHGLTSSGSVIVARPGRSETRFVWT